MQRRIEDVKTDETENENLVICVPEISILFAFSLFCYMNGTIALWLSNFYTKMYGIRSSSVESLRFKILFFFFCKEPKSTVFILLP